MPLSDRQIERYSRQIIVPGIGGSGQERLLASSVTICGDLRDIEVPLAYLAGSGIGHITLVTSDASHLDELVACISNQNPDVTINSRPLPGQGEVSNKGERGNRAPLLFAIIASESSLEMARSICDSRSGGPTIVARLDEPARVAILPEVPPCPQCGDVPLLAPSMSRSENADFVALIAAAEAFKLLAQYGDRHSALLIEFTGLATHSRTIAAARRCECSILRGPGDAR